MGGELGQIRAIYRPLGCFKGVDDACSNYKDLDNWRF